MLSQTFFDRNDTDRLQTSYKKFSTISYLTLIIGIPVEVLIGYVASIRIAALFWPVALLGLAILLSAYYIVFFKRMKSFRQDLAEQTKLVGSLRVVSKSEKDKQLLVSFDSDELKQANLARAAFDKINIGDILSVEFSKYARYIFKMSKGDDIIINGN